MTSDARDLGVTDHRPGLFVTIEGGDGAGKSTLLRLLAERATGRVPEVVVTREPGGTPLGERLRAALLGRSPLDQASAPSPIAELLVFAAARAQLVAETIRPALQRGALVLCDRFADSTVAYQQYGRGLPAAQVDAVNGVATAGLVPALTVLLDLDPAEALRRRAAAENYFEEETIAFHQRVRAGFATLAAAEPARWLVLDAVRPPEALAAAAWQRVKLLLDPSVRD